MKTCLHEKKSVACPNNSKILDQMFGILCKKKHILQSSSIRFIGVHQSSIIAQKLTWVTMDKNAIN